METLSVKFTLQVNFHYQISVSVSVFEKDLPELNIVITEKTVKVALNFLLIQLMQCMHSLFQGSVDI